MNSLEQTLPLPTEAKALAADTELTEAETVRPTILRCVDLDLASVVDMLPDDVSHLVVNRSTRGGSSGS